jgi:ankyrin repeat protein
MDEKDEWVGDELNDALLRAVKYSDIGLVQQLLEQRADPNHADHRGITPLILAALNSNTEVAQLLLEADADPNQVGDNGMTPLLMNIEIGIDIELVGLLLEAGADPNQADRDGTSPLSSAILHEDVELVHVLLDYEADPNSVDNYGITMLSYVIQQYFNEPNNDWFEIIQLMLDHDANVNYVDPRGNTALIMAAHNLNRNSAMNVIQLLLKAGANPNHVNNKEETALLLAVRKLNIKIVKLLLRYGAIESAYIPINRSLWSHVMDKFEEDYDETDPSQVRKHQFYEQVLDLFVAYSRPTILPTVISELRSQESLVRNPLYDPNILTGPLLESLFGTALQSSSDRLRRSAPRRRRRNRNRSP